MRLFMSQPLHHDFPAVQQGLPDSIFLEFVSLLTELCQFDSPYMSLHVFESL